MPSISYIWDSLSDSIIQEQDAATGNATFYTMELNGTIISQNNSDTHYYHFDGKGNVCQLTDAEEAVTDSRTYDAFGDIVREVTASVFPFQFNGAFGSYTDDDEYILFGNVPYSPNGGRLLSAKVRETGEMSYSLRVPLASIIPAGGVFDVATCLFARGPQAVSARGGPRIMPGGTAPGTGTGIVFNPTTLRPIPVYVAPGCDIDLDDIVKVPNEVKFPTDLPPDMPKEQIRPQRGTRLWEEYTANCWADYEARRRRQSFCRCICVTESGREEEFFGLRSLCPLVPETPYGRQRGFVGCACDGKFPKRRPRRKKLKRCHLWGSGMCNKKTGLKLCQYNCDNKIENVWIHCGPGNWDPECGWERDLWVW